MTKTASLLIAMMVGSHVYAADGDLSAWMRVRSENRPKFPTTYVAPKGGTESLVRNSLSFEAEEDVARRSLPDSTAARSWKRIVDAQGETLSVATIQPTDGVTWSFAVYNQLGNLVPYYWTGEGYPQVTDGDRFAAAVRRLKEVLGKTASESQIAYATNVLVRADTEISMLGGETVDIPFERSVFLFIDDRPGANWAHPCRYVFFSEDLAEFAISYQMQSPRIRRILTKERMRLKPIVEDVQPESLEQVVNTVQTYANEMSANNLSYAGDVSHSYFVLVSGGADPEANGIRFWADTAMLYSTLTLKYGVPKDHIHVLVSDGTDPAADANLASTSAGVTPVLVSSPTDLDGDGVCDVDGPANWDAVNDVFVNELSRKLTANDQLLVFISSHGSSSGTAGINNHNCLGWLYSEDGDEYFFDTQLHSWTKDIPCPVAFAIETCYSGGFIDDIVQTPNRVIATACDHYESSWGSGGGGSWGTGGPGQTRGRNAWAFPFNGALRGFIPKSGNTSNCYPWQDGPAVSADRDGNGLVSMAEADAYARANDSVACHATTHVSCHGSNSSVEHPQFAESTAGIGEWFCVIKQGGEIPVFRPVNDDFANATTISGASGSLTASSANATKETGEPYHGTSSATNSVWWKWTATTAGSMTITTEGSGFDTGLGIYTGNSVSALTKITSNDDEEESGQLWSSVTFSVSVGTTYYIAVAGYKGARGSVKLNWSFTGMETPRTYSITYALGGGTHGATHPTSATYGTAFYVSAPTRSGYAFAGWTVTSGLNTSTAKWGTSSSPSTTISSSSTKCVNGATGNVYFKNLTPTANGSVTLTANWTAVVPLSTALDNTTLTFTTGGDAGWFGQGANTHDGTDAARSGAITHNQNSWMQTTVTGPGTISFWWYASCEGSTYDYLSFSIDGVQTNKIGGTSCSWTQCSYTLGAGSHVLKWTYRKDGSFDDGLDAGFVDQVVWTPASSGEYDSLISDFEGMAAGTPVTTGTCDSAGEGKSHWFAPDDEVEAIVKDYGDAVEPSYSGACGQPLGLSGQGDRYLCMETTSPLWRTVNPIVGGSVEPRKVVDSLTFDFLGILGPFDVVPDLERMGTLSNGVSNCPNALIRRRGCVCLLDDKLAVYLLEDEETEEVSLCVQAGSRNTTTGQIEERIFKCSPDGLNAEAWNRISIKAMTVDGRLRFLVYFNGELLSDDAYYARPQAGTALTVTALGFAGSGSVDNIVIGEEDPVFAGNVPVVTGSGGYTTYTYIEWQTVVGTSQYRIYRSVDMNRPREPYAVVEATKKVYCDYDATPGVDYRYWLSAVKDGLEAFAAPVEAYRRASISTLTPTTFSFWAGGGSHTASVVANAEWQVERSASWIGLMYGQAGGEGSVCVTVGQNTSSDKRTATVTVTAAAETDHPVSRTISVTQEGKSSEALSKTLYVSMEGSDAQSGDEGAPLATIQAAIDHATEDSVILVGPGVYAPISTEGKRIVIRGVDGPGLTVIDGGGTNRCAHLGSTTNTVLDGLTLRNGAAGYWSPYDGYVRFEEDGGGAYGGTLVNCHVVGNRARNGGGCYGTALRNCKVCGNAASEYGGGACYSYFIGGLAADGCYFSGNSVGVIDNSGWAAGSALYFDFGARGKVRNCIVAENVCGRYGNGGAVASNYGGTDCILQNCTVVNNGGGMTGGDRSAGVYGFSLINSIIRFNLDEGGRESDIPEYGSRLTINGCCVSALPRSGYTGSGNTTADPKFVDLAHRIYRLQSGSPCLNAGVSVSDAGATDAMGRTRIAENRIDMGACEGVALGAVVTSEVVGDGLVLEPGDVLASNESIVFTAVETKRRFVNFTASNGATTTDKVIRLSNVASDTTVVATFEHLTFYVDASRPNDLGDGLSWGTAKKTISAALSLCARSDEVIVADGTYGAFTVSVEGVTIRSVNGPEQAVIDGGGKWRCVDFSTPDGGEIVATLEGFALCNGQTAYAGGGAYGGILKRCVVRDNVAGTAGGGLYGCRAENTIIVRNSSETFGGGAAYSTLVNCSVAGNRTNGELGGGLYLGQAVNTVVWGNEANGVTDEYSGGSFTNCVTSPLPAGTGNRSSDPRLVDAVNGDVRLRTGSPLKDSGNPSFVVGTLDVFGNARVQGSSVDVGAIEGGEVSGHVISVRVKGVGDVSPRTAVVSDGGSVTLTAVETSRPFSHYLLYGLKFSGREQTLTDLMSDLTVTAVFTPYTFYVDAAAKTSGDGQSWATAKRTIQEAVDVAETGETVRVAPGIYSPISTHNKRIVIDSEKGPAVTVIDGGLTNRCATLADNSSGHATVLRGFTLTHGVLKGTDLYGGGAYAGTLDRCIVSNCQLLGTSSSSWGQGAGLAYSKAVNTLIVNNIASNYMSYAGTYSADLKNCTVTGNRAVSGTWQYGGTYYGTANNCIIWGNEGGDRNNSQGTTLKYCCVDSSSTSRGTGCVVADPQFVDAANGDYRLAIGSPCIGAGLLVDADVGEVDLDGLARVVNGTVDIGAYEWQNGVVIPRSSEAAVVIPLDWFSTGTVGGRSVFSPSSFAALFGTDYAIAAKKPTGKIDAHGNPMYVWQDFIAGTDPTDKTSEFKASISFVDGEPVITWTPDLNEGGAKSLRTYRTLGISDLSQAADPAAWREVAPGNESAYKFFKVEVDMK